MVRLIKLLILSAIFLAGYYVGNLPGSPDIFGAAAGYVRDARQRGLKASTADHARKLFDDKSDTPALAEGDARPDRPAPR